MNFIGLLIRQPVTVAVGVILIVMSGVLAIGRVPIQLTPNVESTTVTVTTFWEGASPQEVEQNIVDKQEERLLGLSNLRLMTSNSRQGEGRVRLEFATGTDKAEALRDIVRDIPLDRLLIETDAPYLAPEPKRGKRNEPAFVAHTAAAVAKIKDISTKELTRITGDNTRRLFSKIPAPQ